MRRYGSSMLPIAGPGVRKLELAEAVVLALAFCGIALFVYEPLLRGPLLSDDLVVLAGHPYMEELSAKNLAAILDPTADPVEVTANYAPVHLLSHVVARELFGPWELDTGPHHVINVVLHGFNSVLLVALLSAWGVPLLASVLLGLFFLVHPGNVEAVALLFQLKTLLAFSFGFGALLALPRRPSLATILYALALLAKPTATAVLAAAIVFEWVRRPGEGAPPRRMAWLVGWGVLTALYAIPEFQAFSRTGEFRAGELQDPGTRVLQAVAIVGRYLVLMTTSLGSSSSHQPVPPASVLNSWFLLGLAALLAVGAASWVALRRRHPAAAWLGLAVAAYLPVSQIARFKIPMADRYLYFLLPGLMGAAAVALAPRIRTGLEWLREGGWGSLRWLGPVLLGVVLVIGFSYRAHQRCTIYRSAKAFQLDGVLHYPDSMPAHYLRAREYAASGDAKSALESLEEARERGLVSYLVVMKDPAMASLQNERRFQELLVEMARFWVAKVDRIPRPNQYELMAQSDAYEALGEFDQAIRVLEKAKATEGTANPAEIHAMLGRLRRLRAARVRLAPPAAED